MSSFDSIFISMIFNPDVRLLSVLLCVTCISIRTGSRLGYSELISIRSATKRLLVSQEDALVLLNEESAILLMGKDLYYKISYLSQVLRIDFDRALFFDE